MVPAERRRARRTAALCLGILAVLVSRTGATHAAFVGTTADAGSSTTANPDWTPPITTSAQGWTGEGGTPGVVRSPGNFPVITNTADDPPGGPPSGVGVVTTRNGAAGH